MVSRNKKQQTIGRRELIGLILSLSLSSAEEEEEEEEQEEEEEAEGAWNCGNSFQIENRQIFGYARLKQFKFLIHLLLVALVTTFFSTHTHTHPRISAFVGTQAEYTSHLPPRSLTIPIYPLT